MDIRDGVPYAAVLGYPFTFPLLGITPPQLATLYDLAHTPETDHDHQR